MSSVGAVPAAAGRGRRGEEGKAGSGGGEEMKRGRDEGTRDEAWPVECWSAGGDSTKPREQPRVATPSSRERRRKL